MDDLENGVRFYAAAFGLRTGRRFGDFGVEMLGSSVPIYLLAKEAGTPDRSIRSRVLLRAVPRRGYDEMAD